MEFNFNNEGPIYIQLVRELKISIVTGKYPLGSRLPSVRDLALTAKVNPNTMQKALIELEKDKLIYTERTNGKYVTNDEKVINKIKESLAKDIVNKYINSMNDIGISLYEAIIYLQERGGE